MQRIERFLQQLKSTLEDEKQKLTFTVFAEHPQSLEKEKKLIDETRKKLYFATVDALENVNKIAEIKKHSTTTKELAIEYKNLNQKLGEIIDDLKDPVSKEFFKNPQLIEKQSVNDDKKSGSLTYGTLDLDVAKKLIDDHELFPTDRAKISKIKGPNKIIANAVSLVENFKNSLQKMVDSPETIEDLKELSPINIFSLLEINSNKLLNEALTNKNKECIELCIANNLYNEKGKNLLHLAILSGDNEFIDAMSPTQIQEMIAKKDNDGVTPLHLIITQYTKNKKIENEKTIISLINKIDTLNNIRVANNLNITDRSQNSVLHLAVLSGNSNIISALLDKRFKNRPVIKINEKNFNGDTALHLALEKLHQENIKDEKIDSPYTTIVKNILSRKPIKSLKNSVGYSPIELALKYGSYDLLGVDKNGNNPLHLAILNRSKLEDIKELVERFKTTHDFEVNQPNGFGLTPFLLSIQTGDFAVFEYLLNDPDVSPNDTDNQGLTALHIAANFGQTKMAEILIEKGLEVDAKSLKLQTPLHLAAKHSDTFNFLVKKLLVKKNSTIPGYDFYDKTPLHYAAEALQEDVIDFLIEKGVDVISKSNIRSKTVCDFLPITKKYSEQTKRIRKKLFKNIKKNFDGNDYILSQIAKNGDLEELKTWTTTTTEPEFNDWVLISTPIMQKGFFSRKYEESPGNYTFNFVQLAAMGGNIQLLKDLIHHKIHDTEILNLINNAHKENPLFHAVRNNQLDMAKFLIEQGALQNGFEYDNYGNTLLNEAVLTCNEEMIQLLINNKANVNSQSEIQKQTPLIMLTQAAKDSNDQEKILQIADILLKQGADLTLVDHYKEDAITKAYKFRSDPPDKLNYLGDFLLEKYIEKVSLDKLILFVEKITSYCDFRVLSVLTNSLVQRIKKDDLSHKNLDLCENIKKLLINPVFERLYNANETEESAAVENLIRNNILDINGFNERIPYLFDAVQKEIFLVVKILVAHGADLDCVFSGKRLLHLVSEPGFSKLEITKCLIDKISNPNKFLIKDHNGDTPFHLALRNGKAKILNIFLEKIKEKDVDLSITNENKDTLLHELFKSSIYSKELFDSLIKKINFNDLFAKNNQNQIPFVLFYQTNKKDFHHFLFQLDITILDGFLTKVKDELKFSKGSPQENLLEKIWVELKDAAMEQVKAMKNQNYSPLNDLKTRINYETFFQKQRSDKEGGGFVRKTFFHGTTTHEFNFHKIIDDLDKKDKQSEKSKNIENKKSNL